MRFLPTGRFGDVADSQRLARISLFTSLVLMTMVLILTWSRESDNASVVNADSGRITQAVEDELDRQTRELARWSVDALGSKASEQTTKPAALSAYLVDLQDGRAMRADGFGDPAEFNAVAGLTAGSVAEVRARVENALRGSVETDGAAQRIEPVHALLGDATNGLVAASNKVYAISVAPIEVRTRNGSDLTASRIYAAVGLRDAAGGFLAAVAQSAHVGALDVLPHPTGDSWRAYLSFSTQGHQTFIEWQPDRPGDRTFGNFGSLLVSFAALFAGLIAVHTTSRLADNEARAAKAAGHDLLSGLPNRLLFTELLEAEIARTERHGGALGLLFLDLDRFKEVNDTFGHNAGDCLLIAATRRISALLRKGDIFARFGGDEFAVLLPELDSAHVCEQVARRILEAMREPFELGAGAVSIGASIGIALGPRNARDGGELMRLADLALYRAKNTGRNRFCFFEDQMGAELRVRKSAEDELRTAIDTDRLDLFYQPIVAADGKTIISFEALARWRHPLQGLLLPEAFVTLADDRGLALPLGEWALRRACRDASRWPNATVAVNVSPIQFRQADFAARVFSVLDEIAFDPELLEIEITESALDDPEQAEKTILDLRSHGVKVTLDDFGTGHTSLIYMRRFAFDKIKIDQSFLGSLEGSGESALIVQTIVHFARALGLRVVAEGIETEEQFKLVTAAGCNEMQGFYFAHPAPPAEVVQMLEQGLRTAA